MPAYVLSIVAMKDGAALAAYRAAAASSIAAHGGRYLVRGGGVEVLEGNWPGRAVVLVAFPDKAAAEAWYRSPEYARALCHRDEALCRDLVLLEGFDEGAAAG